MNLTQNQIRVIAQLFINMGIAVFVTYTLGPILQLDKIRVPLFFIVWGIFLALPLWIIGIKLSR